jgi:hypothetical protein
VKNISGARLTHIRDVISEHKTSKNIKKYKLSFLSTTFQVQQAGIDLGVKASSGTFLKRSSIFFFFLKKKKIRENLFPCSGPACRHRSRVQPAGILEKDSQVQPAGINRKKKIRSSKPASTWG